MRLKTILTALAAVGMSLAATFSSQASDAVCANPQSSAEIAICEDQYLLGLSLQINNVLYEFIAWRSETGELPEAQQFAFGNHWIGLEDCEGSFRCIEDEMRTFLSDMEDFYLDNEDTVLNIGRNDPFILFQSEDSPGWDLIPSGDKKNYGWTQRLCQLRCAAEDKCAAVGYAPLAFAHNLYGYCTMKSKAVFPLKNWRQDGVLLLKR